MFFLFYFITNRMNCVINTIELLITHPVVYCMTTELL